MLRFQYDTEVDALYLTLAEGRAAETIEVEPSVYIDLNTEGHPLGIEFLNPGDIVGFLRHHGGAFEIPDRVSDPLALASD